MTSRFDMPQAAARAHGLTDVGCVRDHNEDALWADAEAGLYIVADGMGGHAAGEVASAIVVEKVPEFVRQGRDPAQALCETHQVIRRAADEGRGAAGMGSTAVVLRTRGTDYEIAWVGDSRAYLWDGKGLRQLTRDHSFIQRLLDAQAISFEDAGQHPDRNVITQALGMVEYAQVHPDTATGRLYRGEKILLCSDGLSGEVSDDEIVLVLASNEGSESQGQALVDRARRAGGADNITVILVRASDDAPPRPSTTEPFEAARLNESLHEQSRRRGWIAGLAIGAGLVVALAAGWGLWHDESASFPAGGQMTTEQKPQSSPPPAVSVPPPDAVAAPLPSNAIREREPENRELPARPVARESSAKVTTVAPLGTQKLSDDGTAREAKPIAKAARGRSGANARKAKGED